MEEFYGWDGQNSGEEGYSESGADDGETENLEKENSELDDTEDSTAKGGFEKGAGGEDRGEAEYCSESCAKEEIGWKDCDKEREDENFTKGRNDEEVVETCHAGARAVDLGDHCATGCEDIERCN